MKRYMVEVIESRHWEFGIEADDEDDARDRVKDLMDGSYMDPLHYDREVTVREQGVMGAGFDPQ